MDQLKYLLSEKDIPTRWYNIQADLPAPLPPVIHPGTKQPIGPQDLAPLFPMELIKQEVSTEDGLISRKKFVTSTSFGGPLRFTAQEGLKRRWTLLLRYFINTKVLALQEATNQTQRLLKHTTT